jgi:hypothetical protein
MYSYQIGTNVLFFLAFCMPDRTNCVLLVSVRRGGLQCRLFKLCLPAVVASRANWPVLLAGSKLHVPWHGWRRPLP